MQKNLKKYIFLFAVIFLFLAASHQVFALEQTYPGIPGFSPPLTDASTLPDFIFYFFSLAVVLASILGVISIVIAGIILLVSAGSPGAAGAARDRIFGSILGIVLLMFSVALLTTINPSLTNLKTTSLSPTTPNGIYLVNSTNGIITAPPSVANTSDLGDFTTLLNKCGASPRIVVQKFSAEDLDNNSNGTTEFLACGESTSVEGTGSYKWSYEEPGVYLFSGEDCTGNSWYTNTTDTIDTALQQNVRSAWIFNGESQNEPRYAFVLGEGPLNGFGTPGGVCSQTFSNFNDGGSCVPIFIANSGCGDGGGGGTGSGVCYHASADAPTSCVPNHDGDPCQTDEQCGFDGHCDLTATQPDGSTGACVVSGNGQSCSQDSDCSGPTNNVCDFSGSTPKCVSNPSGNPCTSDAECSGGTCNPATDTCIYSGGIGQVSCSTDDQCVGADAGVCNNQFQCVPSDGTNNSGSSCHFSNDNGDTNNTNSDCGGDGYCNENNQCVKGADDTGAPACNTNEDSSDGTNPSCGSTGSCNDAGQCVTDGTGTGADCNTVDNGPDGANSACDTSNPGFCNPQTLQCVTDGSITDGISCNPGEQCSIVGQCNTQTHQCVNSGGDGDSCTTNATCGGGGGGTGFCDVQDQMCSTFGDSGISCNFYGANDCKPTCNNQTGECGIGGDGTNLCDPNNSNSCGGIVNGTCDGDVCVSNGSGGQSCNSNIECGGTVNNGGCDSQGQCVQGAAGSGNGNCGSNADCHIASCDSATQKCDAQSGGLECNDSGQCGGGGNGFCIGNNRCSANAADGIACKTGSECTGDTSGHCDAFTNKCVSGPFGGKGCSNQGDCKPDNTGSSCLGNICKPNPLDGTNGGVACDPANGNAQCGATCTVGQLGGDQCLAGNHGGGPCDPTNGPNGDRSCQAAQHEVCDFVNWKCDWVPGGGVGSCIVGGDFLDCQQKPGHTQCIATDNNGGRQCQAMPGPGSHGCDIGQPCKMCQDFPGCSVTGDGTCICAPIVLNDNGIPLSSALGIIPYKNTPSNTDTGLKNNTENLIGAIQSSLSSASYYNQKITSTKNPLTIINNNAKQSVRLTFASLLKGFNGITLTVDPINGGGCIDSSECNADEICVGGQCQSNNGGGGGGTGGGGNSCTPPLATSIYVIRALNLTNLTQNESDFPGKKGVSLYEYGGPDGRGAYGPLYVNFDEKEIGQQLTIQKSPDDILKSIGKVDENATGEDTCKQDNIYPCTDNISNNGNYLSVLRWQNEDPETGNPTNQGCGFFTDGVNFDIESNPPDGVVSNNRQIYETEFLPIQP